MTPGAQSAENKNVSVKNRPTLIRVFHSVFVEFFTDIGKGLFQFFKRYIILMWDCLRFIWWPDAEYHETAQDKTLKNTKYTFQFILILTSVSIFLVKQGVIETTDELRDLYGNDIFQYMMEFIFFLIYTICFFAILILLILVGRILRKIFKPIEDRDVTDKVFIHLNNIFFLFNTIAAFVRKFSNTSKQELVAGDGWIVFILWYAAILFVIVFLFFIRLVIINKATKGKAIVYSIIVPAIVYVLLLVLGFSMDAFLAFL